MKILIQFLFCFGSFISLAQDKNECFLYSDNGIFDELLLCDDIYFYYGGAGLARPRSFGTITKKNDLESFFDSTSFNCWDIESKKNKNQLDSIIIDFELIPLDPSSLMIAGGARLNLKKLDMKTIIFFQMHPLAKKANCKFVIINGINYYRHIFSKKDFNLKNIHGYKINKNHNFFKVKMFVSDSWGSHYKHFYPNKSSISRDKEKLILNEKNGYKILMSPCECSSHILEYKEMINKSIDKKYYSR